MLPETEQNETEQNETEPMPGFAAFIGETTNQEEAPKRGQAKQKQAKSIRFASRPVPAKLTFPSLEEVKRSTEAREDNRLAGNVMETVETGVLKGDPTLGAEAAQEALRQHKNTAEVWRDGVEPIPFEDFVPLTTAETKGGKTTRLSERQLKVFNDCGLNAASGWIDPARRINEIVLLYGKGSGKDWLSAKANAYLGYLMCHLKLEPATYYRQYCGLELEAGTTLSSLNVAPSAELALQTYFGYLRKNLSAPLFHEFEPRILTESVEFCTPSERSLAKKQGRKTEPFFQLLSKHSKSSGLDGYNLIFWVMDEADAFYDKAEKSNAEEVHGILRSSCNTRMGTYWTGMVISYPRVKDGFMLRLYERASQNMLKLGPSAGYYADLAATWEVRPSVSRLDPNIVEDYEHDPAEAAARYECKPLEALDAFIEMPEKIDASVEPSAEPVAYVTVEDYQTTRSNGYTDYYVRARIEGNMNPIPGHEYFLGGDAGQKRDAYALSVWHTDNQVEGFNWICPRCAFAAPTILSGARYEKQGIRAREIIRAGQQIICGSCYETAARYHGSFSFGSVLVANWFKKQGEDQSVLTDNLGRAYNVGHIYEDLLVQIKPVRKGNASQVNRSVFFPAVQTLCRDLIEKLPIAVARFDPYQTAEITMGLRESTGGDIDEISFSNPEQYKRGKLAKMMLYAGLLHFLPNERRDREWKRLQRVNGNKIDHPDGQQECFIGETRIPLLDGTCPMISELDGKEIWVYSARPDGKIVPGKATGRKTKLVTELVDVVLDNGSVTRCTPEHPWMLRDGTYVQAKHLRPGIDRLMPIGRQWPVNGGYERVSDLNADRVPTHRMVYEYFNGTIPDDCVVHHRNEDKTNNSPGNLELAAKTYHTHYHTSKRWQEGGYDNHGQKMSEFMLSPAGLAWRARLADISRERYNTNPEYRAKVLAGFKRFNESDEGRCTHSESMKRTVSKMTSQDHRDNAKKRTTFRHDITPDALSLAKLDPGADTANGAARVLGCGRNVVMRVLKDMGYSSWTAFLNGEQGVNHKVRYVIPVNLEDAVPVYDLSVEEWDNFALSCGVFVHNSKDLYDAESVCIWLAVNRKIGNVDLPFGADQNGARL